MFKTEIERDLKKSGQILSLLRNMATAELAKQPQGDTATPPGGDSDKGQGQGDGLSGPDNTGASDKGIFDTIVGAVTGLFDSGEDTTGGDKKETIVEAVLSYVDLLAKAVKDGAGKVLEIVSRPPDQKGWVLLPKRWVVERTFAWLGRYRINSKEYERLTTSSESQVYISSIKLMLNRICPSKQYADFKYKRAAA